LIALGLLHKIAEASGHGPLILLLGGSLNMYTGVVPFAPVWVQHSGIEFLYRFAREPRRLFHRYFVRDTAFLPLMLREVHDIRRSSAGGR
jgi:N-acetylglucosaminyldiphosphoundecaprenol N-acetyl-beta-D-mannosaminyltransferase